MSFARSGALLVWLIGSFAMATHARAQTTAIAIDAGQSSARFVVHLRIPMRATGELVGVGGELRGSPAGGWRVLVNVDGRSLKFDGPQWMDRITRSDDFLAVDRFPTIRFESAQFSDAALHAGGPLAGELSLRGQTRPVSFQLLPATCAAPGRDCDIQVQGVISRRAFGMVTHQLLVRDDVDFHIRVRLQADSRAP